jgi:lipoprotein-anchoring transpeptidase ErfK/SrfK
MTPPMSAVRPALVALGLAVLLSACSSALPTQGLFGPTAAAGYPKSMPVRYYRQEVADPTGEKAGTIVIDTTDRFLYLVGDDGHAMRYGVGVGREGFAWKGSAKVARKAEWPGWTPPPEMRKRRPDLPSHMEGGLSNPLGARAMYLHKDGRDTMFRIHGTNEPQTIGHAMSSGCIRMVNSDVEDLYARVPVGAKVVVR